MRTKPGHHRCRSTPWRRIVILLDAEIQGVQDALLLPSSDARGYELKTFEDALDAVVCAWVGTCALAGRARAHGKSAIRVPVLSESRPMGSH
ncbi:DUF429 domain-containing protein [Rhizobium laguerreae]|uniref:DUF429 domain-containing protein n=1 Tax=Rhizobium laguerreae TaxID=1076926 RepID=A0A7Y2R3L3_9HYPH|nr:DUF429 domain-containing protein [Rhizobium laguerreae]